MRLGAKRKTMEKLSSFRFLSIAVLVISVCHCFLFTSAANDDHLYLCQNSSLVKGSVEIFLKNLVDGLELDNQTAVDYIRPDTSRYKNPMNFIHSQGFNVSKVRITSFNGYIVNAWRIRCRKNCGDKTKYPVLLQHGLFCSGADWLFVKPESVLPFILADAGYEVWIGNARGTKYSQEHERQAYDPDYNPKFFGNQYWNYTVDDMGVHDVPATIDTMKELTKTSKINYVGYSMGTTMFFIYASENKTHYEQNVNRFVGLAPAIYIDHFSTQFKFVGSVFNTETFHCLLRAFAHLAGIHVSGHLKNTYGINQGFKALNRLAPHGVQTAKKALDEKVMVALINGAPLVKNVRAYQRAMGYFPEDISFAVVRQYVQFFEFRTFANFRNHGPEDPRRRGKEQRHTVGDVRVPTLLIGGANDSLVAPQDFRHTAFAAGQNCTIEKCAQIKANMVPCFTHLDFIWGPNVEIKTLVYNQVLSWFDDTWDESKFKGVLHDERDDSDGRIDSQYCRSRYLKG